MQASSPVNAASAGAASADAAPPGVVAPANEALDRLLEHPAVWRGRSAAAIPTWPTGHAALDAALPGGGWPRAGLVEILVPHPGIGELTLLMPALARLSAFEPARWTAWIAPPVEPFAPALVGHGLAIERQLVVRTRIPLWAMEQSLGSGACEAALAWARQAHPRDIRRLQLATERGRTLGFLFREAAKARESSPAMLRIALEPVAEGVRVHLVKSRGGNRKPIEVAWETS